MILRIIAVLTCSACVAFAQDMAAHHRAAAAGQYASGKVWPTDWASGAIAIYRFNEGTGTNCYDSSVNGRTATFVGAPAWADGGINGWSATKYVKMPVVNYSGKNKLTISAWVKNTSEATENQGALGMYDGTGGFFIQYRLLNSPTRRVLGVMGGASYNSDQVNMTQSAWTHVAMVYDGTKSTDLTRLVLYRNGSPVTGYSGTAGIPATMPTHTYLPAFIGTINGITARYWIGTIKNVMIWDGAMTDAQMLELYNASK